MIDMLAVNGWGVNIWYSEEGTGWAVTFGTARRGLGGLLHSVQRGGDWVGCYIWYSEEETGLAAASFSHLA